MPITLCFTFGSHARPSVYEINTPLRILSFLPSVICVIVLPIFCRSVVLKSESLILLRRGSKWGLGLFASKVLFASTALLASLLSIAGIAVQLQRQGGVNGGEWVQVLSALFSFFASVSTGQLALRFPRSIELKATFSQSDHRPHPGHARTPRPSSVIVTSFSIPRHLSPT